MSYSSVPSRIYYNHLRTHVAHQARASVSLVHAWKIMAGIRTTFGVLTFDRVASRIEVSGR